MRAPSRVSLCNTMSPHLDPRLYLFGPLAALQYEIVLTTVEGNRTSHGKMSWYAVDAVAMGVVCPWAKYLVDSGLSRGTDVWILRSDGTEERRVCTYRATSASTGAEPDVRTRTCEGACPPCPDEERIKRAIRDLRRDPHRKARLAARVLERLWQCMPKLRS